MHLLHNRQQRQLICFFFIFVTQTSSTPIKETVENVLCNILHHNCALKPSDLSASKSFSSSEYLQNSMLRITKADRQRTNGVLYTSTSTRTSTTKSKAVSSFDDFSDNLKRAALILAGIALGLGILRICLMLCKSNSRNNSTSTRHSAVVRPQVSTIEHHQFKPDLPPAYAEAVTGLEYEGGKLPAYEELPDEQRQVHSGRDNNGFLSTTV